MIAVGSEEGGLEFIDASQTAQWDRGRSRSFSFVTLRHIVLIDVSEPLSCRQSTSGCPSVRTRTSSLTSTGRRTTRALFVPLSPLPRLLSRTIDTRSSQVTASGAQVSGVFDVETQQLVASLVGHTSSVKTALFDTSNPGE